MTEQEFKNMPFLKRFNCLRTNGEHVSSRTFGGYEVHLYIYEGLYIEVWSYMALKQVIWIEPLRNPAAWKEYLDNIELPDDPMR